MPLTSFTQTEPGEIFVRRNIANQVSLTDINFLSVLDYAISHLKVQHLPDGHKWMKSRTGVKKWAISMRH